MYQMLGQDMGHMVGSQRQRSLLSAMSAGGAFYLKPEAVPVVGCGAVFSGILHLKQLLKPVQELDDVE